MSSETIRPWRKAEVAELLRLGYRKPEEISIMCMNKIGKVSERTIRVIAEEGGLIDDPRVEKRLLGGKGKIVLFFPIEMQITILEKLKKRPKFQESEIKIDRIITERLLPRLPAVEK